MKIIPNDLISERAVLGSILVNESVLDEVKALIDADDFFDMRNRLIFEAMISLAENKTPIEPITLNAHFEGSGKTEKIGGIQFLSSLMDETVVSVHAEHYAKIVKAFSLRRKMILQAQEIAALGFDLGDTEVNDYLLDAYQRVEGVLSGRPSKANAELIKNTIDEAYREAISGEERKGLVKTGIGILDHKIGGIWPGLLTILASRPSMGKSMFGIANIAVNVGLSGKKVLLFSPEDTRQFVQWRILSRLSRVPLEHIVQGRLSVEEKQLLQSKRLLVDALSLWIEDSSAVTADEIRKITIEKQTKHGLDLLIIDHLGHLVEKGKDYYEKITTATRKITQIAKDLNIAVLCLHQLNRATLSHKNNIPDLGDLRQSGEIEQLARVVWFVHRPHYYDDMKDKNEFGLKIAKNSHGRTEFLKLYCDMPTMFVSDTGSAKETEKGYNY